MLDAFNRLAMGSVPGNLPQMLDGRHDPKLESLSKELRGKISRLSILARLMGNLIRNPPLNASPKEADVREVLVLIESDSEPDPDGPAPMLGLKRQLPASERHGIRRQAWWYHSPSRRSWEGVISLNSPPASASSLA